MHTKIQAFWFCRTGQQEDAEGATGKVKQEVRQSKLFFILLWIQTFSHIFFSVIKHTNMGLHSHAGLPQGQYTNYTNCKYMDSLTSKGFLKINYLTPNYTNTGWLMNEVRQHLWLVRFMMKKGGLFRPKEKGSWVWHLTVQISHLGKSPSCLYLQ